MPSPFPGMNPWVEDPDTFPEFHGQFPVHAIRQLAPQLAPKYRVRIDKDVYIHPETRPRTLLGEPDIFIVRPHDGGNGGGTAVAVAVGVAPDRIEAPVIAEVPPGGDDLEVPFIEIVDPIGGRVVTSIEILSPTNKDTRGRETYLNKRHRLLRNGVNLVEIDLLREGHRVPLRPATPCDYLIAVHRAGQSPRVGLWPLSVRDPLPVIPIPVRPEDPDARLDLKAILDAAYDASAWQYFIYRDANGPRRPMPPLAEADAAWADAVVAEHLRAAGVAA